MDLVLYLLTDNALEPLVISLPAMLSPLPLLPIPMNIILIKKLYPQHRDQTTHSLDPNFP
jgi:hypothetical protein